MSDEKPKFKLADFVNKEIPQEILEQLLVANRIKHILKPTITSAVSTSSQVKDQTPDINNTIDNLINEVKDLENLVEQLEDMVDEHLKGMDIPPSPRVADSVKTLDPNGTGNITKEVLDKALAIIDHLPMLTLGTDPILAALVGDGTINGPWFNCNDFSAGLTDSLTNPPRDDLQAEDGIKDQGDKIADNHEKRMLAMVLEILLMLWWNMLWTKFVVDAAIINPIKVAIAWPLDALVGFFTSTPDRNPPAKKRFKKPNGAWLDKHGVITKILRKLRNKLLCMPYKIYPRYKPMVEILDDNGKPVNCKDINGSCPPEQPAKEFTSDNKKMADLMSEITEDFIGQDFCFTDEQLRGSLDKLLPNGPGTSPECVKAAKIVLDAVLSDALSTSSGLPNDPNGSSTVKKQITDVYKGSF